MKKLIILLFLCSCGPRGPLFFEAPMAIQNEASFQNLKASIIETKCLTCHSDFAQEENLLPYIDGNDPDKSKLFEVVKDGSMPMEAPVLTTEELELVRSYIQSLDRTPKVTFKKLKDEILTTKCLACHKKMGDEINFEKWVNFDTPLESKVLLRTMDGSMPKNGTPLSSAEIEMIKAYLRKN